MRLEPNLLNGPLGAMQALPVQAVAPVAARTPREEDLPRPEGDSLEISASALARLQDSALVGAQDCEDCEDEDPGAPKGADGEALSTEEQQLLSEMQNRDREVRAHEEAHKAAAGELAAGGPSYETETGPDGRDYAVGGEVQIMLKDGQTPEETIRLAQQARRAALAPAEPSSQDQQVAAEASQREAQARAEAYRQTAEQGQAGEPSSVLASIFA